MSLFHFLLYFFKNIPIILLKSAVYVSQGKARNKWEMAYLHGNCGLFYFLSLIFIQEWCFSYRKEAQLGYKLLGSKGQKGLVYTAVPLGWRIKNEIFI